MNRPITLKQIDKEMTRLAVLRSKLAEKDFRKDTLPAIERMVGKYFAYRRNHSSMPETESDYWDCFREVLRVVVIKGEACLVCQEIQIDALGQASIATGYQFISRPSMGERWEPCPEAEYLMEHDRVMNALRDPEQLCKYLESQ